MTASETNFPNVDSAQVPQPFTPFYLNFLWACNLLWTLILLGMNVLEFFRGGQWTYQGPGSLIYFATLAAYAGVKETHNWTVGADAAETKGRRGVFFVAVWVLFSMGAFTAVNVIKGFVFPHELLTITLEVLGIFFGTQASRALRRKRGGVATAAGSIELEEGILSLARETNGAGTAQIIERLGAQRGEVQYTLGKLVKQGRLQKVGDKTNSPDTKYVAV